MSKSSWSKGLSMNRSPQDVSDLLLGQAAVVVAARSVQADVPRYCLKCCTVVPTTREWNRHGDMHGCKHTCENRKVCEARLAEFQCKYPDGRVI